MKNAMDALRMLERKEAGARMHPPVKCEHTQTVHIGSQLLLFPLCQSTNRKIANEHRDFYLKNSHRIQEGQTPKVELTLLSIAQGRGREEGELSVLRDR